MRPGLLTCWAEHGDGEGGRSCSVPWAPAPRTEQECREQQGVKRPLPTHCPRGEHPAGTEEPLASVSLEAACTSAMQGGASLPVPGHCSLREGGAGRCCRASLQGRGRRCGGVRLQGDHGEGLERAPPCPHTCLPGTGSQSSRRHKPSYPKPFISDSSVRLHACTLRAPRPAGAAAGATWRQAVVWPLRPRQRRSPLFIIWGIFEIISLSLENAWSLQTQQSNTAISGVA